MRPSSGGGSGIGGRARRASESAVLRPVGHTGARQTDRSDDTARVAPQPPERHPSVNECDYLSLQPWRRRTRRQLLAGSAQSLVVNPNARTRMLPNARHARSADRRGALLAAETVHQRRCSVPRRVRGDEPRAAHRAHWPPAWRANPTSRRSRDRPRDDVGAGLRGRSVPPDHDVSICIPIRPTSGTTNDHARTAAESDLVCDCEGRARRTTCP